MTVLPKTKQRATSGKAQRATAVARFHAPDPDLQTQLETLLHEIWKCEADWRLNDRIDLALHQPRR